MVVDYLGPEPSPLQVLLQLIGVCGSYIGDLPLPKPSGVRDIVQLSYDQEDLMPLADQFCTQISYVGCLPILIKAGDKDNIQG